ncbi:MAG: type II toxin-antitoxin system HicB family antitoxin [Proteobacteria bacterium]|nr:type II toxin-antitoxin system HicB family antitoxin [Pseudomonadota bacterium]
MSEKAIAKGYYAVFEYSSGAVEVEFPGLPGCVTFGHDMEEAYDSAIDVLAGWIELADDEYIPEKNLTFEEVREQFPDREIMKIPVDISIMKKYEEKQRFNASFPKSVLEKVDTFAKEKGWNRSQFLIRASEKLISENSI